VGALRQFCPASLDTARSALCGNHWHRADDGAGQASRSARLSGPFADGGFAGALRILAELENGPIEKRVGVDIEGRQPVREGALVLDGEGNEVGRITSGGFSPSLQRPIAMGYVATPFAEIGTALKLEQRGKLFDAKVAAMPFVPHRYHRKGAPA